MFILKWWLLTRCDGDDVTLSPTCVDSLVFGKGVEFSVLMWLETVGSDVSVVAFAELPSKPTSTSSFSRGLDMFVLVLFFVKSTGMAEVLIAVVSLFSSLFVTLGSADLFRLSVDWRFALFPVSSLIFAKGDTPFTARLKYKRQSTFPNITAIIISVCASSLSKQSRDWTTTAQLNKIRPKACTCLWQPASGDCTYRYLLPMWPEFNSRLMAICG